MTQNTLNTYRFFYKTDAEGDVEAETSYEAQQLACKQMQAKYPRRKVKEYDCAIYLIKKGNQDVVQSTDF